MEGRKKIKENKQKRCRNKDRKKKKTSGRLK